MAAATAPMTSRAPAHRANRIILLPVIGFEASGRVCHWHTRPLGFGPAKVKSAVPGQGKASLTLAASLESERLSFA